MRYVFAAVVAAGILKLFVMAITYGLSPVSHYAGLISRF